MPSTLAAVFEAIKKRFGVGGGERGQTYAALADLITRIPAGQGGGGVPAGGEAGQALVKKTSSDYDTQWAAPHEAENDFVRFPDIAGRTYIYADSTYAGAVSDGSVARPYKSVSAALAAQKAKGVRAYALELSKDSVFEEDIVISGLDTVHFESPGMELNKGASVRSVNVAGETNAFSMDNIAVTGTLVYNTGGPGKSEFELYNASVSGNIILNCGNEIKAVFGSVTFEVHSVASIIGNKKTRVEYRECTWETDDPDMALWKSGVVQNNPSSSTAFWMCMDLPCVRRQGGINFDSNCFLVPFEQGDPNYAFVSENTPGWVKLGNASTETYAGLPAPVNLKGGAEFILDNAEFDLPNSHLNGVFIPSGPGALQVSDGRTRLGYSPVIRDGHPGGPIGRTIANTVGDHLNGISDALMAGREVLAEDQFLMNIPVDIDPITGMPLTGGQLISWNAKFQGGHLKVYGKRMPIHFALNASFGQAFEFDSVDGLTVGMGLSQINSSMNPSQIFTYTITGINAATRRVTFDRSFTPMVYTDGNASFYDMEAGLAFDFDIGSGIAGLDQVAAGVDPDGDIPSLVLILTNGNRTYLHFSAFAVYGPGQGVTIDEQNVVSIKLDPAHNLNLTPAGLGFKPGHSSYPQADKEKLAALPASQELAQLLASKVDAQSGMSLSKNSFGDDDKAKLTALPTNADLNAELAAKAGIASKSKLTVGALVYDPLAGTAGDKTVNLLAVKPVRGSVAQQGSSVISNYTIGQDGNTVTMTVYFSKILTTAGGNNQAIAKVAGVSFPHADVKFTANNASGTSTPSDYFIDTSGVVRAYSASVNTEWVALSCTYIVDNVNAANVLAPDGVVVQTQRGAFSISPAPGTACTVGASYNGSAAFTVPAGTAADDIIIGQQKAFTGGYREYFGGIQWSITVSGTTCSAAWYVKCIMACTIPANNAWTFPYVVNRAAAGGAYAIMKSDWKYGARNMIADSAANAAYPFDKTDIALRRYPAFNIGTGSAKKITLNFGNITVVMAKEGIQCNGDYVHFIDMTAANPVINKQSNGYVVSAALAEIFIEYFNTALTADNAASSCVRANIKNTGGFWRLEILELSAGIQALTATIGAA